MKRVVLYIDLVFWLVFLPLLTMLIPVELIWIDHSYFLITLAVYLVCLYVINRFFNIPALLLNRQKKKAIIVLAAMLLATYLMTLFPFPDTGQTLTDVQIKMRAQFRAQMIWFLFLVVMGFCFSFGLFIEIYRQRGRQQEIEAEKNRAQLALYKAQINPHFLFNTLNTLYGLALMKSDKMESAFVKFSDILKYMYSNADKDSISIEEEIEYISQYIDLQSLRLNEHTQITFDHIVDDCLVQIPPMVLITFVENAFKYGVSSTTPSNIKIDLKLVDHQLHFIAQNHIVSNKTSVGGVGVENCRKRLELLYPNRFNLTTQTQNGDFITKLDIQLD